MTEETDPDLPEPFEYDPSFRGPIKSRSCTDLYCLYLFIIFVGAWIVLAGVAIRFGDPERVIYPSDSFGRICGRDELIDKPFLYFFDILQCAKINAFSKGCNTTQVCVKKCPDFTESFVKYRDPIFWNSLSNQEQERVRQKLICDYEIKINEISLDKIPDLLRTKRCGRIYFKSEPFLKLPSKTSKQVVGRCVPDALSYSNKSKTIISDNGDNMIGENGQPINTTMAARAGKGFSKMLNLSDIWDNTVEDLGLVWKHILIALSIAMIISFIWILLLQVLAGPMVWFSMFAVLVLSTLAVLGCLKRYFWLKSLSPDELDDTDIYTADLKIDFSDIIRVNLHSILMNKKTWLVFSIICGIVSFLLAVTFVFLRSRVNIAISLIKEASKALDHAKSALFLPFVPYILQTLVIIIGIFVAIMIAAVQKPTYRISGTNHTSEKGIRCDPFTYNGTDDSKCEKFIPFSNTILNSAHFFNLFMTFWLLFFINGMVKFILAGAFAAYYWAYNKPDEIPSFPVATSTYRAFRYHAGSIAFGSLILAIFRMIRLAIEYVYEKCKKYTDNAFAKAIMWTCRCCFWMLEKFMRFLNTNAYIMIAVHGQSFLPAAKEAFFLLLRNVVRVAVLDKVADYLLMIGKLVVTAFMGLATFFYFTKGYDYDLTYFTPPDINYTWVPVIAVCIGTYFIADCFFDVYEMAVDTIFLCFLEDCERNDGSPSKPYFMSEELMEILEYRNQPTAQF